MSTYYSIFTHQLPLAIQFDGQDPAIFSTASSRFDQPTQKGPDALKCNGQPCLRGIAFVEVAVGLHHAPDPLYVPGHCPSIF